MSERKICRRDMLKLGASTAIAAGLAGTSVLIGDEKHARLSKALGVGMLQNTAPSDAERFAIARKCGFEGIEAEPLGSLDAMREQAQAAKQAGVPVHGLMFNGWTSPLSAAEPEVVKKGLAGMENALRCANAIGVNTVLLVPAVVTEDVTYAQAYERSQKHIRELLPLAAELKIVVAIENVWNKFLLSPLEFARYIDEFDSPWVRAYFDVGNCIVNGYAQDWIRTVGRRIIKIHVKDFKRQGNKWMNLLDGDVNWLQVRRALGEIGYEGFLTAEVSGGGERYLTDLAKRMDKIIAM